MKSFAETIGMVLICLGGVFAALTWVAWFVDRIVKRLRMFSALAEFILYRKEFQSWFPSRWELRDAFHAAEDLEDWLGRNAGDNADWPVRMTVGDEQAAEELTHRLNRLKRAIADYRAKNPLP